METGVKTISIQEAADALGVTPGTIQLRLQRGDLKGMRSKTEAGNNEWRVFLSQKSADYAFALQRQSITFSEKDIIDPDDAMPGDSSDASADDWRNHEKERVEFLAETLLKPLTDRIEAQALALHQQARMIEEQALQLRRITDLESKVRIEREATEAQRELLETERQISDCYKSENAELRKQVSEMSEAQNSSLDEITSLEAELEQVRKLYEQSRRPWWKKLF